MSQERRDSYRFTLEKGQAVVDLGIPEATGLILDICASGSAIVLSSAHAGDLEGKPVTVRLENHPPFSIRLIPERIVKKDGSQTVVGVRFGTLNQSALSSLSQFLIERFIDQKQYRSHLLQDEGSAQRHSAREQVLGLLLYFTVTRGRVLKVYQDGMALPVDFVVAEMNADESQQSLVLQPRNGSAMILDAGREYLFSFAGSHALNFFRSIVQRVDSNKVQIEFPMEIRQTRYRDSRRGNLGLHDNIAITFAHPRLPETFLTKQIIDVSARGFSFLLDPSKDALFPGERINHLIAKSTEATIRLNAVIRSLENAQGQLLCGLEILGFEGTLDQEQWEQHVFHVAHPNLRLGTVQNVDDVWKVLHDSGYLKEVTPTLLIQLTKNYFTSWEKHGGETQLSRFFLLYNDKYPIGTLAANLIYPGTWLVHNLGIDEKERKKDRQAFYRFVREVYAGIIFLLQHLANCRFYVLYVDAGKQWNNLIYGRFLEKYPKRDEFLYDRYKVYKHVVSGKCPIDVIPPTNGMEVLENDKQLIQVLSKFLKNTLPAIEYDAFCYDEQRMSLEDFSKECGGFEYERERHIFFAREGDRLRGALIAETGSEGINIFGLFNKCWFVDMVPEEHQDNKAKEVLLSRAVRYFIDKGKPEFIFIGDKAGEPDAVLKHCGFEYVADGLRWLARKEILPAYLNYTEELLEMLHG